MKLGHAHFILVNSSPVPFIPYHATTWMYLLSPAFSLSAFISPIIYCPSSIPSPTQTLLVSQLPYALQAEHTKLKAFEAST